MFNSQQPSPDELPSSKQLIRSTIIAFLIATAILFLTVIPAEYGVDPTGVGELLGLKAMGEIKTSLKQEALSADNAPAETVAISEDIQSRTNEPVANAIKNDITDRILAPGDAIEIKIEMTEGTVVQFSWTATNGKLNYNLHGDGYKGEQKSIGYKKGAMIAFDEGELIAAFDGYHGWYWRNREKAPVSLRLETIGDYIQIKQVM